jgi:hypothetical protein
MQASSVNDYIIPSQPITQSWGLQTTDRAHHSVTRRPKSEPEQLLAHGAGMFSSRRVSLQVDEEPAGRVQ